MSGIETALGLGGAGSAGAGGTAAGAGTVGAATGAGGATAAGTVGAGTVLAPAAGGALANISGLGGALGGILTPAEVAAGVAPGALTGSATGGLAGLGNAALGAAKGIGKAVADNPVKTLGATAQGYKTLREELQRGAVRTPMPQMRPPTQIAAPQFGGGAARVSTPGERLSMILTNQRGGQ